MLLKRIEGRWRLVTGLAHSARVKPGNLFFCLPGRRYRGWEFAQEASSGGCGAGYGGWRFRWMGTGDPCPRCPSGPGPGRRHLYRHPSRRLRLIGLPGPMGRPLPPTLSRACLKPGEVTGLVGTVGGRIGRIASGGGDHPGGQRPAAIALPDGPAG